MASDGCDPPIPPLAKSDKEKGKKKSYMVKLLNRFNNVNASSSQPYTPTSTSIARFVPPPLQVTGLTPTAPSIPPSLEVPAFTPSPQQFAADQWTLPSPHVGSNPTTPTNMPSPPPIGDNPPHSSSAANDFEDVSNNRPIITPIGGGVHEHAIRLSQELGRSVHVDEIFQQTHIRASTGQFVDERSRRTHEEFEAKFSQIRSETAFVGASACSPLDPADEERLRNQCWLDVAGGRYKGRVYGIGNVSAQDDCVDSYIQQTQASSSQQPMADDISNLHTRVSTHDDQLRQMNSQLQGFIGVIMQYLPPPAVAIAQQFFQSQNQS
ncbi:hypothetical protein LR48_Vigan05g162300 [Vigna angularis]|uniref:Uncharacterized protein n=1 Tax=Phaseolus angularis TaxID=3914 RepID=A0A0L9UMQ4_PHAAN|nr:hypothetical protein LR48_Vigan05g162300 [Vigna angularis]